MSTPRGVGRVDTLVGCPLLTALPLRVLQALAPRFEATELDTGDLLFEIGGRSACLFIVEKGDLELEGPEKSMGRVSRGGFLCEEAVLRPGTHKSRARATSPSLVLSMDEQTLSNLWAIEPASAAFLQLAIGSRLITELRRANTQFVSLCEMPIDEVENTGMRRILKVSTSPEDD